METIFQLLAGVVLAALVFAATLYSFSRIFTARKWLRRAHLFAVIATLGAMGSVSYELLVPMQLFGGLLLFASLPALALEKGTNRLLPFSQQLAGLVFASGMPLGL